MNPVSEIYFKAIRKEDDKWVHGYYFCEPVFNGPHHLPTEDKHWIRENNIGQTFVTAWEVYPETVCQYTTIDDRTWIEEKKEHIIDRNIFINDLRMYKGKLWGVDWSWNRIVLMRNMSYFGENDKVDFDEDVHFESEHVGNIFDNMGLLLHKVEIKNYKTKE